MKLLCIVPLSNGTPLLFPPIAGPAGHRPGAGEELAYVVAGTIPGWASLIVAARAERIQMLKLQPHVLDIVQIAGNDPTYLDAGLNVALPAPVRTRLNDWISANTIWPAIPSGRTSRQVINEIFRMFNPYFNLARFEVLNYG